MNKDLLLKDIRIMLKDLKFQIFFVILTVLFILSSVSSAINYQNKFDLYQEQVNSFQGRVKDGYYTKMIEMLSNNSIFLINKPGSEMLFNTYDNYPDMLTNKVDFFNPYHIQLGGSKNEVFKLNWFFILGVLTGFIMLIMSFEAMSKEKRAGTLRLLSIYGFKRQVFFWHKYISYMILFLIVTIPACILSMLLFFVLTGMWSNIAIFNYILIYLISTLFASFFILLGIFISMSKNYRSNIVMVIFIWLLFVIIIPQSANIFGKIISPLKTSIEYGSDYSTQWNNEFTEWQDKYEEKVGGNGSLEDGLRAAAVYAADEKANSESLKEINDNLKQIKTINMIANISPFGQLEKIGEIIFDQGFYLLNHQHKTIERKMTEIKNLMIEQDSKDSNSLHLFYSWANSDKYATIDQGIYPFSNQVFEQPELLLITEIETDSILAKTLKILLKLLPIIILNLIFIVANILKINKLDIR
jgi:ABC-type transport system involved in multi-copper enzyme maturation permease subunit